MVLGIACQFTILVVWHFSLHHCGEDVNDARRGTLMWCVHLLSPWWLKLWFWTVTIQNIDVHNHGICQSPSKKLWCDNMQEMISLKSRENVACRNWAVTKISNGMISMADHTISPGASVEGVGQGSWYFSFERMSLFCCTLKWQFCLVKAQVPKGIFWKVCVHIDNHGGCWINMVRAIAWWRQLWE